MAISLDVFRDVLEERGADEGLCFIGLMPGAEFLGDYVGCGGMAWIQLVDSYDTINFPTPASGVQNCAVSQPALTLVVGMLRSVPGVEVVNDEPILPTQEESTDATLGAMDDMETINVFLKRLSSRDDIRVVTSTFLPSGPSGGSIGGTRSFAITSED